MDNIANRERIVARLPEAERVDIEALGCRRLDCCGITE
jgi:hypothetical protein